MDMNKYQEFTEAAKSKKIVVFGASIVGQNIINRYLKDYDVLYYCDNKKEKWDTELGNYKVFSPDILLGKGDIIIIMCVKQKEVVRQQLRSLGIVNNVYHYQDLFNINDFSLASYGGGVCFELIDLIVTTRCSLKCKYCSSLIPYYTSHQNFELNTLLSDIDKLLACVDHIDFFSLLGGEPLIYKDLDKIIEMLLPSDKISNIKLTTNGTIIPKPELIELLKNEKIIVMLSNYGKVSTRMAELIEIFNKEEVNYYVEENFLWKDFGDIKNRNRDEKQLTEIYSSCEWTHCTNFHDGKLFSCFRESHCMNLGVISDDERYYVNIRELDTKTAIKKIKEVWNLPYIRACNYCDGSNTNSPIIEAGIQME